MSASTVSVTNPRRRTSAVSDAKQGIEIVNDATISPNIDNTTNKNAVNGDAGDDKVNSGGNKDLSHSIRGEAVVEKSKDKKSSQLPNSNAPIRTRNRKTASAPLKAPKPRWQTVVRVLAKNILVVLVLIGLIQMGRKLMLNSGSDSGGSLMGFSDMEGRIAGVESSLKTTTKMFQVQVEVVDKKIESEVGNLRREMNKKIEDKSGEIGAQLRRLEERSKNLESGLVELKSKSWSKDELIKFYDEIIKGDGGVMSGGLSYDAIRGLAREVVKKEIEKHTADGLGMADYALGSAGAKVVGHSEPLAIAKGFSSLVGKAMNGVHNQAEKMLNPSFGEPGQCFPLKGSSGFVVIRLRAAIAPEAVTLEHVAESVAFDRSSAPKNCRVSGWFQGQKAFEDSDKAKMFLLTEFSYDLEKSNAQTFNVLDETRSSVVDTVMFEFSSNHGSATHTCIYRLRVHGHEPKSVPVIPADS